jgi:hypothetical protein
MKIIYSKGYTPAPTLRSLKLGEVFRPLNSQRIYMTTMYTGLDDIFSDTAYGEYALNIQTIDDPYNAAELRACIDLENGKIVFFHFDIQVKVLECELNIVEEVE